ncbi:MAG: DoxX family membrane protein [Chloroflexi bacterium]|nr:DoxX family membrane protein [Chloroflexota bacterium]
MNFLRSAWQIKDPALWLALVRIVIGYEWLKGGWEKVADPEFAAKMGGTLAFFAKDNPNGWYVDFLNAMALPNSTLFAALVAYGELWVGISLILGLFGTVGAFFGLLMNINFFLAASHLSPSTYGINLIMALVQVILILGGASKAFGLDQLLYDRLPRLFPWWLERAPEPAGR